MSLKPFKVSMLMLLVAGILAMAARDASALGIGVYGQIKNAWATVTADYYHTSPSVEFVENSDATRRIYSFGFVLDSNVSMDTLFNYRLQIGIGFGTLSIDGKKYKDDIDLIEYSMYHSFGFGIVRTEKVRVWLGPQIGFGYASGEYSYAYESNKEFFDYFVCIGAVLGFNIHVTDGTSIGLSGGVRKNFNFGGSGPSDDLYLYYKDSNGGIEAFGEVALLFRFE